MNGEIYIGRAEDDTPVYLRLQDLLKGVLVCGQTGTGKTSLLYLIAIQLLRFGVKVWWLDSIKNDGLFLTQLFLNVMLYFRLNQNFLYNPLQFSSGRSYEEIVLGFVEQFCRDFHLLLGSETYLMQQVNETIGRSQHLGNSHAVTVREVQETVRGDHVRTFRMLNYRDATQGRLEFFLNNAGWTLDCRQGFDITRLAGTSFNLDLVGCQADVQGFFAGDLIRSIISSRRAAKRLSNDLDLFIVFDEANRLFPRNQELSIAESIPTLSFVSQISREYGVGLCGATQTPSFMASSGLKSQSYVKILIGSLGSNEDYYDMCNVMGMNRDQVEWLKTHSKVGQAIVKLAGGEFTEPFLVRVPFVNVKGIVQ